VPITICDAIDSAKWIRTCAACKGMFAWTGLAVDERDGNRSVVASRRYKSYSIYRSTGTVVYMTRSGNADQDCFSLERVPFINGGFVLVLVSR
jgi:hypothetical protein